MDCKEDILYLTEKEQAMRRAKKAAGAKCMKILVALAKIYGPTVCWR
jgi:predicted aconitase